MSRYRRALALLASYFYITQRRITPYASRVILYGQSELARELSKLVNVRKINCPSRPVYVISSRIIVEKLKNMCSNQRRLEAFVKNNSRMLSKLLTLLTKINKEWFTKAEYILSPRTIKKLARTIVKKRKYKYSFLNKKLPKTYKQTLFAIAHVWAKTHIPEFELQFMTPFEVLQKFLMWNRDNLMNELKHIVRRGP